MPSIPPDCFRGFTAEAHPDSNVRLRLRGDFGARTPLLPGAPLRAFHAGLVQLHAPALRLADDERAAANVRG